MKSIFILFLTLLLMIFFSSERLSAKKPAKTEPPAGKTTPADRDEKDPAGADEEKPEKIEAPKAQKKTKSEKPADEEARVRKIEDTLTYGLNDDRKEALDKIHTIKDPIYRLRLGTKVADLIKFERNPDILEKAVIAAGDLGSKSALPVIAEKLDDQSRDVRIAAVNAIQRLNGVEMKDRLIQKLKAQDLSKDDIFTEALIRTLGEFKAAEIMKFSIDSVENIKTSKINRENMVLLMGSLGSKEPRDILMKLYKNDDEDQALRAYAVNSLAKIGVTEALSDIKNTMAAIEGYPPKKKEKYHTLYVYSMAALAKLGDPEAVPKLMDATRNSNPMERYKAIKLLRELKDKRSIDILKYRYKNDPSQKVRNAARDALKDFGIEAEGGEIREPKRDSQKEPEEKKQAPGAIKQGAQSPKKDKN